MESKEEMEETVKDYGIEELIEQYISNQDAGEIISNYIKNLENKLEKIEFEIDNSDMSTGVENIMKIIKE